MSEQLFLIAHIAGRGVAIDSAQVESVVDIGAVTPTPRAAPHIRGLAALRSRVVTVIDAGRILNPLTGRNQIEGAIAMGVGMALFEDTQYEPRHGKAINSNLADYVMTTHADSPEMDVVFLDYPDTKLNALGARGIGEIGLAGFAAAVANATYHATGVRVRDLPIRIEDLLRSTIV